MEILGLIFIVLAIAFYFLPIGIAMARNAAHQGPIFWINFLFGWTVLGWIAALLWAVVEKTEKAKPIEQPWSDKPIPNPSWKNDSEKTEKFGF